MAIINLIALVSVLAYSASALPTAGRGGLLPFTTNPSIELGFLCTKDNNQNCFPINGQQGMCYSFVSGANAIVSGYTTPGTNCDIFKQKNCKGRVTYVAPGQRRLEFGELDHSVNSYGCWRGPKNTYAFTGV